MEKPLNLKKLGTEVSPDHAKETFFKSISVVERLHQKLHYILALMLEKTPFADVSPVQALLMYNISDHQTTVGELKTRGFYLGTNVTYNLKKLVKAKYVNRVVSPLDKRSMKVSLTPKGKKVRELVNTFFNKELETILEFCPLEFHDIETSLHVNETWDQFWALQIQSQDENIS
ncbi:MAG: winged helix DNA-binding protein [Sphingomonadales bacterium]